MTDEEALFAAICACPEDDTPRKVYADWLEETASLFPDSARRLDTAARIRSEIAIAEPPAGRTRRFGMFPGLQRHEPIPSPENLVEPYLAPEPLWPTVAPVGLRSSRSSRQRPDPRLVRRRTTRVPPHSRFPPRRLTCDPKKTSESLRSRWVKWLHARSTNRKSTCWSRGQFTILSCGYSVMKTATPCTFRR